MVVVESKSMMHEDDGSLGAIDPGDLIMVMSNDRADVVTFVEATEEGNENFGYESHGLPGDVIIYRKNGGTDTPVIHRALLEAVANGSGWDVPGTSSATSRASLGLWSTIAHTTVGLTSSE